MRGAVACPWGHLQGIMLTSTDLLRCIEQCILLESSTLKGRDILIKLNEKHLTIL